MGALGCVGLAGAMAIALVLPLPTGYMHTLVQNLVNNGYARDETLVRAAPTTGWLEPSECVLMFRGLGAGQRPPPPAMLTHPRCRPAGRVLPEACWAGGGDACHVREAGLLIGHSLAACTCSISYCANPRPGRTASSICFISLGALGGSIKPMLVLASGERACDHLGPIGCGGVGGKRLTVG